MRNIIRVGDPSRGVAAAKPSVREPPLLWRLSRECRLADPKQQLAPRQANA